MTAMMGYAFSTIPAPTVPKREGGIVSVANVLDVAEGDHALLGAEYITDACAESRIWTNYCVAVTSQAQCDDPGDLDPELAKNFDADFDQVTGFPFAVYAGVACGNQRLDAAEARARHRLEMTEAAQIDGYVWKLFLANGAVAPVPGVTGTVDVCEAVGAIEEAHATFYGGITTLLVPRRYINCLAKCGYLSRELDGSLRTLGGSLVAPVTRPVYDDQIDPTNQTGRVIGVGQITVIRSPIKTNTVGPMIRQDGSCEPSRALAERMVVVLFECDALMVEVTCCCGEAAP
jgi:hypothetical protein